MTTHLSEEARKMIEDFTTATVSAWMDAGIIKTNSWGVWLEADDPNGDFENAVDHRFGFDHPEGKHDAEWYIANAKGKCEACFATGKDSHEAVRTWQGMLNGVDGIFPWGGAIIDTDYGICVGVSGFREDEDLMVARAIRNFIVMLLDRKGQNYIDETRARGKDDAPDPSDRFTRASKPDDYEDFGEGPIGREFSKTTHPNLTT
ncbi:hypothetical protein HYX70_02290 [Candidatus Saccharibacteria bacterium]|nr:hypothetical protein [Candidatus Saccharibacteria bacterium]